MIARPLSFLFATLSVLLLSTTLEASNWPQFRGPSGNGTADGASPPLRWSDSENIVWKTELPGRGASSPIVFEDRVFLTAYTGYGIDFENPGEKSDLKLHTLCFDRSTGKLLWTHTIPGSPDTQKVTKRVADHGYATPTPCTDGQAVYSYFGVSGIVACDMNGAQLWHAHVGKGTAGFGCASSPVVEGDLVYVNASIESETLYAFDRVTGEEVWTASPINRSWTTPCLAEASDGSQELILNQKDTITTFDPITGKKLWWCEGIEDYIVPVPVFHDGIAYCLGGRSNRSIAVRLGGRGEVTETHRLWKTTIGANVTSPVYYDGYLYWASDKAVQNCLRASDGEEIYRKRLPTRSRIYSSLVRAGDRFYVTTRDKGILVLAAKPEYEELAINVIESDESLINASPAISGDRLFIRTDAFLYCLGEE